MRKGSDRHRRACGALAVAAWLGLSSLAQAEEPTRHVWVFFRDKGPVDESEALRARARELPVRTLERRRRNRHDQGVDERDLAVASPYVRHVEATGVEVRVRSRWLNAVSVEATASQIDALRSLPEVERIESVRQGQHSRDADFDFRSPTEPTFGEPEVELSQEQLDFIGLTPLQRDCGLSGAGVVVGVQDSGFDLGHQALAGSRVLAQYDFINDDEIVANEEGDPARDHQHGTVVLGILAGNDPGTFMGSAPGVQLILSKTERSDVEIPAEEDLYVAGLEWIEEQGADIFLASLGYIEWHTPEVLDGQTTVTAIAVNAAFENGMLVVTSAGNEGPEPSTMMTPADAPGALSVGAISLDDELIYFSSRGPTADGRIKPDVMAPGGEVISVLPGSPDQYWDFNGTSVAAPLVAGLAALLLEAHPELSAAQLADLLRDTATQADMPNNDFGWGTVDARLASGDACGCDDADDDGYVSVQCGGGDCDDANASISPGITEVCEDGIDNDCRDGAPCMPATEGADESAGPISSSSGGNEGNSSSSSGSPANDDGTNAGCSCTTSPGPAGFGLVPWLLLLATRRWPTPPTRRTPAPPRAAR